MKTPFLSVQILRFVGAWLIVIHHYEEIFPHCFNSPLWNVLVLDLRSSVDLFFLISGFVICHSSKNKTTLSFWKSRICRIFSVWWFYLLLFLFFGMYFPNIWEPYSKFEALYFIKSFFYMHGNSISLDVMHDYPFISQGWSLNQEIFFYLIFSTCLFMSNGYRILSCSIFILFFLFSSIDLFIFVSKFFYPLPNMIVFIFGLCIAYIYEKEDSPHPLILVALFLIGVYGLLYFKFDLNQTYICYGLPWALIFYSIISLEKYILKFSSLFMWAKYLGDWSYSTYLNHAFVLYFTQYLISQGFISQGLLVFMLNMLAIMLLSCLSFHYIEMPLKKVFNNFFDRITFYILWTKRKLFNKISPEPI